MIWTLTSLIDHANSVRMLSNGKWIPVRPLRGPLVWKIKAAWLVLTDKADAFIWPEDEENPHD